MYEYAFSTEGTSASEVPQSTRPASATINSSTMSPEPTPVPHAEITSQVPEHGNGILDEDLEAFLQELASSDELEAEPEPTVTSVAQTETAEDAEERRRIREAETAEKRIAITGRHEVWEQKLRALSESHVNQYPTILAELRQRAVSSLESYKHAETVEADAERALRNTEAFVKRLVSQPGTQADKVQTLEDLVSKVKKRFEDSASVLSDNIVAWWENAQAAEHEAVGRRRLTSSMEQ